MRPPTRSLVGCVLLSGVLGSIHAYSLFIESFESDLGVGRGEAGAPYSVALASLTVVVLVSHLLFRLVPGPLVVLIASGGAAIGLLLAASANSLAGVVLGYGVVFGAFNGLGYAFSLQRASESNPDRRGFALGLVTAAYALGGASTALVLDKQVAASGATSGLRWLAVAIAVTGIVTSVLLTNNDSPARRSPARLSSANLRILAPLWTAYLLAVLAGLMALGHAAAIVDDAGGPGGAAVVAAGLASASGGLWIALVADRTATDRLLRLLPLGSAVVLVIAAVVSHGVVLMVAVAGIAFTYGALIAIYPLAVAQRFGQDGYSRAYGRVFTAWGTAGLVGPVGAGHLFEVTGSYRIPMLMAAVAAIGSSVVARQLSVDKKWDS
ncbi:MAG: OFA family MFS transporter [Actinomycetia bacterium]|nr:OFA family MFS transporter [Actinomycetes bacterium]